MKPALYDADGDVTDPERVRAYLDGMKNRPVG